MWLLKILPKKTSYPQNPMFFMFCFIFHAFHLYSSQSQPISHSIPVHTAITLSKNKNNLLNAHKVSTADVKMNAHQLNPSVMFGDHKFTSCICLIWLWAGHYLRYDSLWMVISISKAVHCLGIFSWFLTTIQYSRVLMECPTRKINFNLMASSEWSGQLKIRQRTPN